MMHLRYRPICAEIWRTEHVGAMYALPGGSLRR